MADNRIRFHIDSVFSGEGFAKAATAVKGVSGTVKNAADGVRSLSGEFGALGGVAGKVADGVGKLFGAMGAGPVGIAVALIGSVVTAMKAWRDSIEKTRQEHQKLMDAMREGYERRLESYAQKARDATVKLLDETVKRGQAAIDRINTLAAAYRNLGAAEDLAARSSTSLESAKVDLGLELNRGIGGSDAQSRREFAAQREKAELEYADAVREATRGLTNANDSVAILKQSMDEQRRVVDAMNEAGKDSTKEQLKLDRMRIDLRAAEHALTAATNKREEVEVRHALTIAKLDNAEQALEEAIEKRTDAEFRAAEKARLTKEADEAIKAMTAKTKAEVAALDRQIAAQAEYVKAVEEAQRRTQSGMGADQQHTNGSFGPYRYHTDPNGNINDFEDYQRAQRFAGRAERDQANTDQRNARFDRELDRLNGKDKLTDSERRRRDQLDGFKKQREDANAQKQKQAEMEKQREEMLKSLNESVKEIKEKLKEALEVN